MYLLTYFLTYLVAWGLIEPQILCGVIDAYVKYHSDQLAL